MLHTKIFGPPGTGKTTTLLNIVDEALEAGIPPDRIAFLAFTRKAAEEALERAEQMFGLPKEKLPHFRTIHSMCYRQLGMGRDELMVDRHYRELGESIGFRFSWLIEDAPYLHMGTTLGDKVARVDAVARLKQKALKDAYVELGYRDCPWFAVNQFRQLLELYKEQNGLRDYTDLLEDYSGSLDVDIFIVDEAQDLTRLQWHVMRQAWVGASKVYMAGDDDQCIFSWAGAEVGLFLGAEGATRVLPVSHRLPKAVFDLSTQLLAKITTRQPKEWSPREDKEGSVTYLNNESQLAINKKDTYMLLARTRKLLQRWEKVCKDQGKLYTIDGQNSLKPTLVDAIYGWEQGRKGIAITAKAVKAIRKFTTIKIEAPETKGACSLQALLGPHASTYSKINWMDALDLIPDNTREYVRSCLAKGQKLTEEPKIKVSTIHRVKGGEADHVAILLDLNRITWENVDSDDEKRVLYVGMTRARKDLTLIRPTTLIHYKL